MEKTLRDEDISKCKDDPLTQPHLRTFPVTLIEDRRRSFQPSWTRPAVQLLTRISKGRIGNVSNQRRRCFRTFQKHDGRWSYSQRIRWCSVELGRVVFGCDADVTWTPPYPFERRTMVEKLNVKELGPDQPDVKISQQEKERGKLYTRGFSQNWYTRKAWLAGCNHANALFCFPCLLFKTAGTDKAWMSQELQT
ncbi:uncharacterized protein [Nothobranchius furzeri]|uniref:uncharacterized protein isoform X2 n=1 Tax=Nothobranchius furzeri TaxID=105023 RepID=UPI0039048A9E